MNLLERVESRRRLDDHDGRSGAVIETGVLDGQRVFVKHTEVATDLGGLLTGDARRELGLWRDGFFDRLPPGVGTALMAVEDHGGRIVTVTRDLGTAMLTWDRVLSVSEIRRVLEAIASVHRRFTGSAVDGLCPLERRISIFSPQHLPALAAANAELVAAVSRGHELFADLVPDDVARAVHQSFSRPTGLAAALTHGAVTVLHGDYFLPNIAVEPTQVTPLDWGLATAGPASIDLVTFCVGAMSNVTLSRHDLLAEARAAAGDLVDDATFARSEFVALLELGWNKALDAVDHPDPTKRANERADLDFWVDRARAALDAGLIPEASPSDGDRPPHLVH